jgi:hypothetical protein
MVMRKHGVIVLLVPLVLLLGCAQRDLPGETDTRHPWSPASSASPGPIESRLFPPELVMSRQQAIGLEAPQRDAIKAEVNRVQTTMTDLDWEMNAEKEKLVAILSAERIDEAKALEAAGRVMAVENRVKSAHLALLVRIKNRLEPAQQAKLSELRARP